MNVLTESGTIYKIKNGRIWRDTANSLYNYVDEDINGLCFKHKSPIEIGSPMNIKLFGVYPGDLRTSAVLRVSK